MYILVIDDSQSDRLLVERELRREFTNIQIEAIGDPVTLEKVLAAGKFDLVITDYQLRWGNGIEVLQQVKSLYPNCPVIMFTNTGSQEIAVAAMKQGLDDYLIKIPKYYARLAPAVRAALQRQEERQQHALTQMRLQSLLNQLEMGVFRVLPNGQLTEANPALLRLLGVESIAAVNPNQFKALFYDLSGLQLNQRRERQIQLDNALNKNLWLRVSETLNNINGQLVIDGVAEDITGIKRSEALLKRYARRLEILQELDRSILQANATSDITQIALNNEYELLPVQLLDVTLFDLERQQATVLAVGSDNGDGKYGLEKGKVVALQDWGNIEPLQQNQIIAIADLAISHRSPVLQQLFEQGIQAWTSVPLRADGQLIGTLSVGTTAATMLAEEDMALIYELADHLAIAVEQSRLREALRRYTEELEQLVLERTQQLAEANEDLETYAYSISHDLQEPLRGIQGFARILQEDQGANLTDAGRQWLKRISHAAQQMETMVQGLLTYNRLNRLNLNLQPLNLSLAVTDALSQLELQIQQTNAQITVVEPLHQAIGHYPTVVQVIANLLANAIKFVYPGVQPQIRVWTEFLGAGEVEETRRRGDTGTRGMERDKEDMFHDYQSPVNSHTTPDAKKVRLWVEDNGIGITSANQERIFGVFERLHAEETYPGTGIGLAIVRRAIERMNGQTGVESYSDRGSRFWIELPAAMNNS